ncbi:MAG TPA: HAD-IA family hydrolase [Pseudonocardia sp.]|jgi:HAD superfamily hydrolase (TIGR01509 family)
MGARLAVPGAPDREIDAVLFDMDGTLVSSDAAVERAWVSWADEYRVDRERVLAVAHGQPGELTVRHVLPDLAVPAVRAAAQRQLELQYGDVADVRGTPGAAELTAALDRLRLPWAVVTLADARLATARLGAAGIAPPLLVTARDVRAGKPDPEGYLLAARRLGVDPARCLVVEDSRTGAAAGHAAGATVATLKGVPGDLPLADLGELVPLLGPA